MDARRSWTPSTPAAAAPAPPWRRAALRVVREPLLHFLLVGALILAAAEAWRAAHDAHRIVVDGARVAALAAKHRLQFGVDPDPAQLEQLVEAYAEEEMLFREGRALGLDQDDEIVRRRVAQKVEFLHQDLGLPAEPGEAELRRFFAAHQARYAEPARVSFRHLYFSPDAGGLETAKGRAQAALGGLRSGSAEVSGDPFPDRLEYVGVAAEEAQRLFGRTELTRQLASAPVGRWSGPFQSGYGWHLVKVEARAPGRPGEFEAVRDRVRGDWFAAAQAAANTKAMAALRARYTVVRADRPAP